MAGKREIITRAYPDGIDVDRSNRTAIGLKGLIMSGEKEAQRMRDAMCTLFRWLSSCFQESGTPPRRRAPVSQLSRPHVHGLGTARSAEEHPRQRRHFNAIARHVHDTKP